jgi:hypothetical protein
MTTKSDETKWGPQQRDQNGTFLAGAAGLPANHRLRAEVLVAAGKAEDPDGIITEELIADTAARLNAEKAAAAKPKAGAAGKGE